MQPRSRQWRGSAFETEDDFEESSEVLGTSERQSGTSGSEVRSSQDRWSSGGPPPPSYDGSRTPGVWEDFKLRSKLWLRTTTTPEAARGPRMLQQLTGRAFDVMKYMAEDESWLDDKQNGPRLLEEMSKPDRFGKEELESLWSALHRLFYSRLRQSDDDVISFRNRFEEANRKIVKHGVNLPSEALGFVYLRQAQVDEATLERIVTMTKGDLTLTAVIDAMRKLKMRLLQDDDKKKHAWIQQEIEDPGLPVEPLGEPGMEPDELETLEGALRELEEGPEDEPISEMEAKEILMTLIRQKVSKPVQNYTYKQVQNMKQDLRNGRGFRGPNMTGGNQNMRKDIQHLKSITTCRNCGKPGHWHRECPLKSAPKGSSSSAGGQASVHSSNHETDGHQKAWWSLAECMDDPTAASSNPE